MAVRKKQVLAGAIGIHKRKLRVTTHFSEKIKKQLFQKAFKNHPEKRKTYEQQQLQSPCDAEIQYGGLQSL